MSNDVSTHTSTTAQRIQSALMDVVVSVPTNKLHAVKEVE
jgi:hypothetical protein